MPPDAGPITAHPVQLDFKGREAPYSEKVPFCKEGQRLRRAILVQKPNESNYKAISIHPNRHPSDLGVIRWADPLDEEVSLFEKFLEQAKAIGLCQFPLPQNPSRFGLFWVMSVDPLRGLDKIAMKADAESQMDVFKKIQKAIPEQLQRCMPPEAQQKYMMQWTSQLDERQREIERMKTDPLVLKAASVIADQTISKAGLADVTEDHHVFLETVIAFGLDHGLLKEDVFEIAGRLGKISSSSEQFLYGFMTIVSLRVASLMKDISPNVDDFTREVESAILDDRVGIRIMNVGDAVKHAGAGAAYNSMSNVIVFPSVGKNTSMSSLFGSTIHECYHVYQDILAKPLSKFDSEFPAYERQSKADVLLNVRALYPDQMRKEYAEELQEYMKLQGEMGREAAKCLGKPDAKIARQEKDQTEISRLHGEWLHALTMEMQGLAVGLSKPIFREYFKLLNGSKLYEQAISRNLVTSGEIVEIYKNETPEATKGRSALERMRMDFLRTEMHKATPGTSVRGLIAFQFLEKIAHMVSVAFFLDQDWFMELETIYFNEGDAINEALLDAPALYNGI